MLATAEELDYHHRLQASQAVAAIAALQVCERYLPELVNWLKRRIPYATSDDVSDAAEDALLSYIRQPAKYDPNKKSLRGYLQMAARHDLLNKLKQRQRHQAIYLDDVGFDEVARNREMESDQVISQMTADEMIAQALAIADDEQERAVIRLMIAGVRERRPYAEALGIGSLPIAEQRSIVNRFKEKLKLRLKRSREQKRSQA